MGMVTEMHLRGAEGGPGERFNYRGMHRYLVTLLVHPSCHSIAERETVLAMLDVLREAGRTHAFEIYAYSFLPGRLVMLIRGKTDEADMKQFLAAFRTASSEVYQQRTGKHLWARKYQERVLRKTEVTRSIAEEIFRLPVKAGIVPSQAQYEFQGSFVLGSPRPDRQGYFAGRTLQRSSRPPGSGGRKPR